MYASDGSYKDIYTCVSVCVCTSTRMYRIPVLPAIRSPLTLPSLTLPSPTHPYPLPNPVLFFFPFETQRLFRLFRSQSSQPWHRWSP